eukprot:TRINITY_DN4375_c0_g1_i1.p1 TRINITY_DN4375_c0_g1~~TRINITY_DN4375_c0_g1_i1.p1  ORF type:complete len:1539 (-),score=411.68 TRINITY_DN4375_c0_g1_i1:23-4108(-)
MSGSSLSSPPSAPITPYFPGFPGSPSSIHRSTDSTLSHSAPRTQPLDMRTTPIHKSASSSFELSDSAYMTQGSVYSNREAFVERDRPMGRIFKVGVYFADHEAAFVAAERNHKSRRAREDLMRAIRPAGGALVPDPETLELPHPFTHTPTAFSAFSCGANTIAAVSPIGVIWMEGASSLHPTVVGHPHSGQISNPGVAVPVLCSALACKHVRDVSCGPFHSVALTTDNEVVSWGYNINQSGGQDPRRREPGSPHITGQLGRPDIFIGSPDVVQGWGGQFLAPGDTLRDVLTRPLALQAFREQCARELSEDNLQLWLDIEEWKRLVASQGKLVKIRRPANYGTLRGSGHYQNPDSPRTNSRAPLPSPRLQAERRTSVQMGAANLDLSGSSASDGQHATSGQVGPSTNNTLDTIPEVPETTDSSLDVEVDAVFVDWTSPPRLEALKIFETFLKQDAPREVQVDKRMHAELKKGLMEEVWPLDIFDKVQGSVYKMMANDTYVRFKKKYLEDAEQKGVGVSCGASHTALWTTKGAVYTFGLNGFEENSVQIKPTLVSTIPSGKNVIQVACGSHFTASLTDKGEIYTWGLASRGQLAALPKPGEPAIVSPRKMNAFSIHPIVMIACGAEHALALDGSGAVYSWGGRNTFGQLGRQLRDDDPSPQVVQAAPSSGISFGRSSSSSPYASSRLPTMKHISCGPNSSASVARDGTLWVWGRNRAAGFIDHQRYPRMMTAPAAPPYMHHISAVESGDTHIAYQVDENMTYMFSRLLEYVNVDKHASTSPSLQPTGVPPAPVAAEDVHEVLTVVTGLPPPLLRTAQDRILSYFYAQSKKQLPYIRVAVEEVNLGYVKGTTQYSSLELVTIKNMSNSKVRIHLASGDIGISATCIRVEPRLLTLRAKSSGTMSIVLRSTQPTTTGTPSPSSSINAIPRELVTPTTPPPIGNLSHFISMVAETKKGLCLRYFLRYNVVTNPLAPRAPPSPTPPRAMPVSPPLTHSPGSPARMYPAPIAAPDPDMRHAFSPQPAYHTTPVVYSPSPSANNLYSPPHTPTLDPAMRMQRRLTMQPPVLTSSHQSFNNLAALSGPLASAITGSTLTIDLSTAQIEIFEQLGGGGSEAKVWRCTVNGFTCALKELSGGRVPEITENFLKEIDMVESIRHENIVRYIGHSIEPEKVRLFMEYYPYSLQSLMRQRAGKLFSPKEVRFIMLEIARGLGYLHTQVPPIIHRDIKTANILMALGHSGDIKTVKITDFDISTRARPDHNFTVVGTTYTMAPEVLDPSQGGYTVMADIWSFGTILVEVLTLRQPYSQFEPLLVPGIIASGHLPDISDIPPAYHSLTDVLRKCLVRDASSRPSAQQLVTMLSNLVV